ncbi:indole-3-glycerol phosphate synthase TrpC [Candidatus Pelagibacter sp.]|nr:indole-3-glycerol phosphate synthase TrpC [Candidatus Pelagibacter sp.]
MPKNILQDIINRKEIRITELKKKKSLESISENMPDSMSYINFKKRIEQNMQNNKLSIIAEIKKASPSAGILVEKYNPVDIAKIYYKNKATCLSVLTEENFFLGSLSHIYKIKSLCSSLDPSSMCIPILCKDFFIDTYQVHLAKYYGADAILIILACVNEKLADDLYEKALKLNMSVIVEVHTTQEAKLALKFKDALIGINNRNLKSLKTDINTTYDIYNILINHNGPLISESGIKTKDELLDLSKKTSVKTFLIGESLLNNLDNNSIFSVL